MRDEGWRLEAGGHVKAFGPRGFFGWGYQKLELLATVIG